MSHVTAKTKMIGLCYIVICSCEFAVNSTHQIVANSPQLLQCRVDLAAIEAVGLAAYRLKCQGEWRSTGLDHTKPEFLHKYPFTLNQDRNIS